MAGMKWKPEDWARLGAVIRRSREEQGYSRKKLSEVSGVSEKSIQLTEEGRVPTRWPKSLDALERALTWESGLMARVLDGYDPIVEMPDGTPLFEQAVDGPVVNLAREMTDGSMRVVQVKRRQPSTAGLPGLPKEIQDALPHVMFFGSNCVAYGAPKWLGRAFDKAAAALLQSMLEEGQPPAFELSDSGWKLNAAALPPRSVPSGQGGVHIETLVNFARMITKEGPATPAKVRVMQKALNAKAALDEYVRDRNPATQRAMLDSGNELNDELLDFSDETGWGTEREEAGGSVDG